jgi:RNA polymerase sigma-70 factor, ECF subfamily
MTHQVMIATMSGTAPRVRSLKSTAELSDEALMVRVARRDSCALEMLYNRYRALALGLGLKVLGDRASAEEVVQEAFWRVWQRAKTYHNARGQFAPWLLSIVHHLAIDEMRKRNARPPLTSTDLEDQSVRDLPDLGADVAATAFTNIAGEQVRAAMSRLPEPQRHVLELAYFYGLTHQEISQKLGEPLGTVHTRTRLALLKLREQLLPLHQLEQN